MVTMVTMATMATMATIATVVVVVVAAAAAEGPSSTCIVSSARLVESLIRGVGVFVFVGSLSDPTTKTRRCLKRSRWWRSSRSVYRAMTRMEVPRVDGHRVRGDCCYFGKEVQMPRPHPPEFVNARSSWLGCVRSQCLRSLPISGFMTAFT
jgi:hypothetical protein